MILLSILGSGAIEIVLLFIGSISLLAGGIWMSRTQPNFDLYLTLSLLVGTVLLTLSVFRIDIFNARDVSKSRKDRYSNYTPIKGNFRNFSVFSTISYVFLLTLCIAVILFTLLPRPTLKSTADKISSSFKNNLDDIKLLPPKIDAEYPSALDEEGLGFENYEAPEENKEINLRWSFLSSLLDKKTRFYVGYSRFGEQGRRLANDDFYTKIKVFDTFDGDKWIVSNYAQNTWSNVYNQDYDFPLFLEVLEAREDTRGGILANAVLNGNLDDSKLNAHYQLIPEQKYTHLYVPDFPLHLELTNFRLNEYTGELKSNYRAPDHYKIEMFNMRYNHLKARVCSKGKGRANKRFLDVGKFDLDLYDLALKIVTDAKKNPEFTEFSANEMTHHDMIRAIIEYLKNTSGEDAFRYEIAPPMVPEKKNALKYFLFDTKIGNCTQFNTAAAVLLRYLDIPTRVIAGYRGGNWNEREKRYEVQHLRAHLWFEVYFKDFGWYRFDATPENSWNYQVAQVQNDRYSIPEYKRSEIMPEIEGEDSEITPKEPETNPDALIMNQDEKPLSYNRFLTDYDNDVVIKKIVEFMKFIFSSGFRSVVLILIILLIPLVYFNKNIKKFLGRWFAIFRTNGKDSSNSHSRKSRQSRIIENKLISDFRDLEKLFKKLGYVRRRSETWIEFNSRLNTSTPLISTMLNSLVMTYYYARFGMNYSEFQDFRQQLGNLKRHLHSQLKTNPQS